MTNERAAAEHPGVDELSFAQQAQSVDTSVKSVGQAISIVVAATFTADLLQRPLEFWMDALRISATIRLAPYGQLMQQLLDAQSSLSRNKTGFNVLLIRPEDWIRDRGAHSVETNLAHVRRVASEVLNAMRLLRGRTGASMLVFVCPQPSSLNAAYRGPLLNLRRELVEQMGQLARVHCWQHEDLVRRYPVADQEDARTESIAHIPYTNEYFIAIATWVARRVAAAVKSPRKVIAVDCDNTLWSGICGEDGAAGIRLTPAHIEFQKLLVRQHDAGMLLCLCSKNNRADVDAVFRERADMPLRDEQLVSSRINWQSKTSNLESLAEELGLSLDSFIFVDDSAVECAEVRQRCPSVLTLQFPETAAEIAHLLEHVWAFDRVEVTDEARQRTAQYRQNRQRAEALEAATDLEQFLASLELNVTVAPMQVQELPRVAELVQRTNQFNLTSIRRRANEIQELLDARAIDVLTVRVQDRFGDYGLVGALFLRLDAQTITVDTFVLSCRVLGRGVEHRILNELGRAARADGRVSVVLRYRQTARNTPAWEFLDKSFARFADPSAEPSGSEECVFTIPAEFAERCGPAALLPTMGSHSTSPNASVAATSVSRADDWHDTAYRLCRIPDIARAMTSGDAERVGVGSPGVIARAPTQQAVAAIFAEVLGLGEGDVDGDFFDLGGDSLQAVRVIARIGSQLGLELSLHEFLEAPTVADVAAKLGGAAQSTTTIARTSRDAMVPLSLSQHRLWFIDQLQGGSAAYDIPIGIELRGELNRQALSAALDALVNRHETLRTVFKKVADRPFQQIAPAGPFDLKLVDLTGEPVAEREAAVIRQTRDELAAPFDLSVGPLIRGRLLRRSADEHVLLITMNHMISDGWSIGVLIRELGQLYGALVGGQSDSLPPLPLQYADYAQWQCRHANGLQIQEQLSYWCTHLQDAPELLELPLDRPRPAIQSYRGASVRLAIEPALVSDLKTFCRRLNATLAMTLFTAWSIVLSRLSGQDDLVVGVPVANRQQTELEGLIGFFVNTLAIRLKLNDDPSVADLLLRAKGIMLEAYARQDTPFESVVEALQPARSLSHSPLFQVMFTLQNAPRSALQLPGLTLVEREMPSHTTQFDLSLNLQESAGGIAGRLTYATDLFDEATIRRWAEYFEAVLRAMISEPQQAISRVPMMTQAERRQLLDVFNDTRAEYAEYLHIHELFEQQVLRTPDAVAVVHEATLLTYAELNEKANQLAWYLRAHGVGPDRLVGICLERSVEMVIGLLGILKAGGAYVPLDPDYPTERLRYMLEDATPRIVLIQERLRHRLAQTRASMLALDSDWSAIAEHDSCNVDSSSIGLCSRHLAYVIYTSGSTGRPKGAMNEHRALINRLQWMQHAFRLDAADRVLQKTPFSFDVSVWEFFWTLLSGARLIVARPQGHQDPDYLRRLIEQTGVTTLHFVPSMLTIFLEQHEPGRCPSLRHIVCSGEELLVALQNKCLEKLPGVRLSNLYGPTEAAVDVTFWECAADEHAARVPIGRPIWNTRMYVLDRHDQPAPIGVAGEICIGGVGVGRGYLNRADLTAQKFVHDAFSADPLAGMYRTGDLGRWRADGAIEYLGRNDHQVKIRGCRIELGEIEAQLARHKSVKEVAVDARQDERDEKQLVAYVVPDPTRATASVDELRAYLKAVLPEFMVPSAFVVLGEMPLTANGKLNRLALPAPPLAAYTSRAYEEPQGELEQTIAGVWQSLLRVERVGRHDNFFELGGHSLLATQAIARLEALLALQLPIRCMFEFPTVRALSAQLSEVRSRQLLEAIADGGEDIERLIEELSAMPDGRVHELMREAGLEERR